MSKNMRDLEMEIDCENSQLCDTVLQLAKNDGAEYPTIGESSDGNAIVVDADSGRVWAIELRELK